jgi:transglutaminase-like putative cysteine protease
MRLRVRHVTRFHYSHPVFCEPLTIRLRPPSNHRQKLLAYSLDVDPLPAGIAEFVDIEGNNAACTWFRGTTDVLTVSIAFSAQTIDLDPFQFLLRPYAEQLPLVPDVDQRPQFDAYTTRTAHCIEVEELAQQIADEVDCATVPFLCRMNEWIYTRHERMVRVDGPAWQPAETLWQRRGSCRDLAVLFIEACRAMSIPARFVSGYAAGTDDALEGQLHAWAEVYLPGAGWRGFDPSLGLAVTERHLAVATGRTPADAAPTSGTFRGDAQSRLHAEIEIQTSENKNAEEPAAMSSVPGR